MKTSQIIIPTDILSIIRKGDGLLWPERLRILFGNSNLRCSRLDVSALFPYADPHKCILDYTRVIPEIIDVVQVFSRMEIYLGSAPTTVQKHIDTISRCFDKATIYGVWDYRMLEFNDLKRILDDSNYSSGQSKRLCEALRKLYQIMGSFFGQTDYLMDFQGLGYLITYYNTLVNATRDAHKTPDIDPGYFDVLESEIPNLVFNKSLKINYRICAALLWLEMFTGLRPVELVSLKTDCHIVKESTSGKKMDFLVYKVMKLSHGGREERYAECYMLPGAVTAFETILELRKEIPENEKTNSLFILEGNSRDKLGQFEYYITRLFIKNLYGLCVDHWEEVRIHSIGGKTYHIPSLTQYRVHLCSYLYKQGVYFHIVEIAMSHLCDAMTAYYVRIADNTFRENHCRADNLIRTQINNDFDLEKHNEKGEALLDDLLFHMSQFDVYARRLEEMKQKRYLYEVKGYYNKCLDIISNVIRPSLSYLKRIIDKEGKDSVLTRHPSLLLVIDCFDAIVNELTLWEKVQKN